MNETQTALARLEQYQQSWELFLSRAASDSVPDVPRSPEDRLRADIRNEAIWLRNAMRDYRRIPLQERY